jgi:hypothetical protein
LEVAIAWPDAPGGRAARVELTADLTAPGLGSLVLASVPTDQGGLADARVTLPIPADAPPSLVNEGLKVGYRVVVIVDRRLRGDAHAERRLAIC